MSKIQIPESAYDAILFLTRMKEADCKALNLISRAEEVILDHDRVFLSARLFTELRPVFDKRATAINSLSIVHTLAIHFIQDEDHKDFHVALDDGDLQSLREVLDRAE